VPERRRDGPEPDGPPPNGSVSNPSAARASACASAAAAASSADSERDGHRRVEVGGRHRLAIERPGEPLVVHALVGGVAVDHEQLVAGLDEEVEVAERPDRVRVRKRRQALALLATDRL